MNQIIHEDLYTNCPDFTAGPMHRHFCIHTTNSMSNLYSCIFHTEEIRYLWFSLIGKQIPSILEPFPDITVDEIGE
ncbi:hypothetical protein SAMN04487995_5957 [Dyadobacter koreensis]|uniref:Uncharacterized protein n=1 Tax=Dyadobacter koreensis TaxID=408657 RepID=A0A1H7B4H4_9BACT|nr:hypothetical protein SAMN04487995_5957 [Dyadobacter koreensis]